MRAATVELDLFKNTHALNATVRLGHVLGVDGQAARTELTYRASDAAAWMFWPLPRIFWI